MLINYTFGIQTNLLVTAINTLFAVKDWPFRIGLDTEFKHGLAFTRRPFKVQYLNKKNPNVVFYGGVTDRVTLLSARLWKIQYRVIGVQLVEQSAPEEFSAPEPKPIGIALNNNVVGLVDTSRFRLKKEAPIVRSIKNALPDLKLVVKFLTPKASIIDMAINLNNRLTLKSLPNVRFRTTNEE